MKAGVMTLVAHCIRKKGKIEISGRKVLKHNKKMKKQKIKRKTYLEKKTVGYVQGF